MSDNSKDLHISDLEHLESLEMIEPDVVEESPKRAAAPNADELPEILYRLKTLHSSETFFGYYAPSGTEWPHFRTLDQLEILLEGPIPVREDSSGGEAESSASCGDTGPSSAGELSGESGGAGAAVDAGAAAGVGVVAGVGGAAGSAADAGPDIVPGAVTGPDLAAAAPEPGNGNQAPGIKIIAPRSLVVAPTKYGKDIVEIQGIVLDTAFVNLDDLILIERPAGIDDLRKLKENREKEKAAYELCRDKIWARNLPMKLVSAHYLLDEPKILFYFTAESRVDFRELVKDLVSAFKMRIELRQIGVRDEARVTGGCGVCGRVLCCHGISDKLNPVSIKMAKDQNLSLNSLKISGPCGRLLCCLSYEHQFYKDARRELPQEGVKFIYEDTQFRVVEVNALTSTVKMAGEDGRLLDMKAERFKYIEGRWKIIEE